MILGELRRIIRFVKDAVLQLNSLEISELCLFIHLMKKDRISEGEGRLKFQATLFINTSSNLSIFSIEYLFDHNFAMSALSTKKVYKFI